MIPELLIAAGAPTPTSVPVNSVLMFIGLLGIGFIVSHFTLFKPRAAIGGFPLFLLGLEYLFLGILIGPAVLNLLTTNILNSLRPIIVLELGWIGILYGLQFQRDILSKTPLGHFLIMLIVAVVTFGIVLASVWGFFQWIFPEKFKIDLIAALMIASIAVVSSPSSFAILGQIKRVKRTGTTASLFQRVSSLDGIFGLIAFAIIFASFHVYGKGEAKILNGWEWGILSILLGVIMGFLLYLFIRRTRHGDDMVVLLLGFIVFSSGIAAFLHLSPLVISFVSGVVLTNRRLPNRKVLFEMLLKAEKVLYVILLIVAGAMCKFNSIVWILALAGIYLLTRTMGKFLGFAVARTTLNLKMLQPTGGFGLLTQGGLAIAMVVSYALVYRGELTSIILTAVLFSVVVFQLISPALIWLELKRADESN